MAARSDTHFVNGLDAFGAVLARCTAADWDRPSPCAGWTVRDVLGHLGTAIDMGISLLRGQQPTWPDAQRPGDLVGDDPVGYWESRAAVVRAEVANVDLDLVMDTPMGPRTVADRLAFPAVDCYVHAWDIGRA